MKKFSTTHPCCALIFCALSFLLISGCATVNNPQPFGEFSASVKELREGADAALQFNDEENREWFLNKAAEDIGDSERGADAIQALAIKGKGFSWYMEPTPLFMASKISGRAFIA